MGDWECPQDIRQLWTLAARLSDTSTLEAPLVMMCTTVGRSGVNRARHAVMIQSGHWTGQLQSHVLSPWIQAGMMIAKRFLASQTPRGREKLHRWPVQSV